MSSLYGELRPSSHLDLLASLGHPSKFQRISCLGSITARHSSSGRQPKFAALNRGRHLHSEGRPSRWALAHILALVLICLPVKIYAVFGCIFTHVTLASASISCHRASLSVRLSIRSSLTSRCSTEMATPREAGHPICRLSIDFLITGGGRNVRPSVRTSVRPQKVCPISMKFGMYIEVDE